MASYSLSYRPSVEKDLQSIPHALVARIIARIERLPSDPFPVQSTKLQGAERLYRLRVGGYRIVYEVDPEAGTFSCSMSGIEGMSIAGYPSSGCKLQKNLIASSACGDGNSV